MAIRYEDMVGARFGRLVVLERLPNNKSGRAVFLCQCDCGNIKKLHGNNLTRGLSKSCGCLRSELSGKRIGQQQRLPDGIAARNALFHRYKMGADRRGHEFLLTIEEFSFITKQDCFYCGRPPLSVAKPVGGYDTGDYLYNGIDRYDNSVGYIYENSVACCKTCNLAKHSMSFDEFVSWIEQVHRHIQEI